jgi:PncC family amidohydrolase
VFAESCTGGLVSGALTKIAGISEFHCGGVVVYRNATKVAYLNIATKLLDDPGPVSAEVAGLMAQKVLEKTPEADVAISVTGHLGPHAPPKLDGRVFVAITWRAGSIGGAAGTVSHRLQCGRDESRAARQRWVVEQVLDLLGNSLEQSSKT